MMLSTQELCETKNITVDMSLYSVCIALMPILFLVVSPISSITGGLGSVILLFTVPYVFFKYLLGHRDTNINLAILLFLGYLFFRSIVNRDITVNYFYNSITLILLFLIIHVFMGTKSAFLLPVARKTIELVSIAAAAMVIIQGVFYYGLHTHITMVPISICRGDVIQQYSNIVTSCYINGMYRPSAFFLEPAYFSQYVSIGLASVFFVKDKKTFKLWKPVLITAGLLLTTSGMGIIIASMLWGFYLLNLSPKGKRKAILSRVAICIMFFTAAYFILIQFDFFSNALTRIFFQDSTGYNAVNGRFSKFYYISNLNPVEQIFGVGTLASVSVYFTGIMLMLYRLGILGTLFFYSIIIDKSVHTKSFQKYTCIILGALFIVGNLYNQISFVFYLSLIFAIETACFRIESKKLLYEKR